ncbi:MAG: GerMN domain-containing protein [Defluviitaleaceae bacterium]|nr:GerMN domain-containing protein [Defluviitaleaceae bacterium]
MKNKKVWIFTSLFILIFVGLSLFFLRDYLIDHMEGDTIPIYYLHNNDLVPELRSIDKNKPLIDKIYRILELMREPSPILVHELLLPDYLALLNVQNIDSFIHINFSSEYNELASYKEALLRVALVRTFHRLGAYGVYFYIEGYSLTNSIGEELGLMTVSNTLLHPTLESHPSNIIFENIVIYRVSENGLIRETMYLPIDDTDSKEVQILEQILDDVQILAVNIIEAIAYIDLSVELEDEALIYAIVNTLTALENIEEVQFLVEGQSIPTPL